MWTSKVVYLLILARVVLAQYESMVVEIDQQGYVRGYKDTQGDMYQFLDVPYATAPTGVHKFKAPLPPPVWEETFDAVDRKISCHQYVSDNRVDSLSVKEDCLVANIYVPDTRETNLPVLVNVHGGAYLTRSTASLADLARTKKVVVVTFNYRLGVHGFLCLGTEDVPGNAGMKDQVALLRWVKKNIASFGGNPDDVTISGCSAGGGSVDFLTISPMAKGLFKKAIAGSGAFFGGTGAQTDPLKNAKNYARQLNFTNVDDFSALEEFYKTASNEMLLSQTDFIYEETRGSLLLFAPCVERKTKGESFLRDTPLNILLKGNYKKVPLFYGFSEMEGLYRIPNSNEWMLGMNEKFSDYLPSDLQFENKAQKEYVAAKVKYFYFGNQIVSNDTVMAYIDYFTDVMFAYPMARAVNMRRASRGDTIYLYEYSFADEDSTLIPNTNLRGAGHCEQTKAIKDAESVIHSDTFIVMRDTLKELWLNFITTGNPTPKGSSMPPWLPVEGYLSPYMSLEVPLRVNHSPLLRERVQFWDSIYIEHYNPPAPPTKVSRHG